MNIASFLFFLAIFFIASVLIALSGFGLFVRFFRWCLDLFIPTSCDLEEDD